MGVVFYCIHLKLDMIINPLKGGMIDMDNEAMLAKVGELMSKIDQNQQLQDLAEKSGLEVKNSIKLTPESEENVARSVISLLLEKIDIDPRYNRLVSAGMQKRSLKTEIINSYKNQAKQLITQYKNNNQNNITNSDI